MNMQGVSPVHLRPISKAIYGAVSSFTEQQTRFWRSKRNQCNQTIDVISTITLLLNFALSNPLYVLFPGQFVQHLGHLRAAQLNMNTKPFLRSV
ncbi:MAG: hypothetical protein CMI12_03395 [Oceanospirillum sp.]|nr:hypothetical protein [Oceanospirillum sp.]